MSATPCEDTSFNQLSVKKKEEEEEEGVAAGLSAMEAEFREIDENGSWSAIYQVGRTPHTTRNQAGNEADTLNSNTFNTQ